MAEIINIILVTLSLYLTITGMETRTTSDPSTPPPDLKPYQTNYLYYTTTYMERAILTTLLDLYRRGNIDLSHYKRDSRNKRKQPYVIELKLDLIHTDGLDAIEDQFVQITFEDKTTTTTDHIRYRSREDGRDFFRDWGTWTLMIESSLKDLGYITDHQPPSHKTRHKVGLAIGVVSALLLFGTENLTYLLGLFASFPVILVYMKKTLTKTAKGNKAYHYYTNIIEDITSGSYRVADDAAFLEILALALPRQDYEGTYPDPSPMARLYLDYTNDQGGAYLDDQIQRAYLGYTRPTRAKSLDTNREIFPTE